MDDLLYEHEVVFFLLIGCVLNKFALFGNNVFRCVIVIHVFTLKSSGCYTDLWVM